ncbi:hypothetical protein F5Y16DRAFT_406135 [Xylariaceae sp. FL0255]|nr:hypothetical protein F5Y16DRAFT_406135 [Xylariaceae sp. FL0255]
MPSTTVAVGIVDMAMVFLVALADAAMADHHSTWVGAEAVKCLSMENRVLALDEVDEEAIDKDEDEDVSDPQPSYTAQSISLPDSFIAHHSI